MQFDSSIPIYLQVSEAIKQDIVAGRRLPGDKLPSGRELALLESIPIPQPESIRFWRVKVSVSAGGALEHLSEKTGT
mgnify:CR=1 FL=1